MSAKVLIQSQDQNLEKAQLYQKQKELEQLENLQKLQELKERQESKVYKKALEREENCLTMGGLTLGEDIHIYNVTIQQKDKSYEWVHTYELGVQNKEILVLLHGYAGSSLTYIRCLKQLAEKYHVYAIDILGKGLSSRPKFDITDHQDILDFFMHFIEQWRLEINLKQKFTLCGHSFGGYLSGIYATRYQQNLKRLLLISPIGSTKRTMEDIQKIEEDFNKNNGFLKRWLFSYAKSIFHNRSGPTKLLDKCWIPSNYIIKRYFRRRLGLPDSEVKLWHQYISSMYQLPESSEKGFFDLFIWPRSSAKVPLETELPKCLGQKLEVHFYYGQYDWMCDLGTKKIFREKQIKGSLNYIESAGHQIVFENPEVLSKKILEFVE